MTQVHHHPLHSPSIYFPYFLFICNWLHINNTLENSFLWRDRTKFLIIILFTCYIFILKSNKQFVGYKHNIIRYTFCNWPMKRQWTYMFINIFMSNILLNGLSASVCCTANVLIMKLLFIKMNFMEIYDDQWICHHIACYDEV